MRGGLFEVDDAFGVGLFVDAVDGGHADAMVPVGDALVGGEHELFDEAVGPGAIGAEDALHLAFVVEVDDGLGKIEVDGAALLALAVEDFGEGEHALELRDERRELGTSRFVAGEDGVDLRVGHALRGADDAFGDFVAEDGAMMVELHDAGEDEAIFRGAEAADVGGELLRQHGDGAIGEVDGGAAQARFEVERRTGRDVLRHVGDVDLQFVTVVRSL